MNKILRGVMFLVLLLSASVSIFTLDADYLNNIQKCGVSVPEVLSDCSSSDTDDNSCCLYSYADDIGCVWLGKRFKGSGTYGGIELTCGSIWISGACVMLFLIALIA